MTVHNLDTICMSVANKKTRLVLGMQRYGSEYWKEVIRDMAISVLYFACLSHSGRYLEVRW